MQNAPFYDKQPTDGISEIFCLVGSNAWNALGYNKKEKQAYGEEWQLLTQATGADRKRLPLVLGKQQLNELHRLKLTDTQKVIRFCVFGDLTETQKTALLQNVAQNTPLETVMFADNLGYETENLSGYIQRLRTDPESQKLAEMIAAQNAENAPKRASYIESRHEEPLSGLFLITPKLDKETGEVVSEKAAWICNDLELAGKGKDAQGEYYYLFRWQNTDEKAPRLEAVHFADFGSDTGLETAQRQRLTNDPICGLNRQTCRTFPRNQQNRPEQLENHRPCRLAKWRVPFTEWRNDRRTAQPRLFHQKDDGQPRLLHQRHFAELASRNCRQRARQSFDDVRYCHRIKCADVIDVGAFVFRRAFVC